MAATGQNEAEASEEQAEKVLKIIAGRSTILCQINGSEAVYDQEIRMGDRR
jgi:hypothetical protein